MRVLPLALVGIRQVAPAAVRYQPFQASASCLPAIVALALIFAPVIR